MDYGAKASLEKYDVKSVADNLLLFSSAFRNLKIKEIHSVSGTTPRNNSGTFTADASTNTLTSSSHGLNNGEVINFDTSDTLPGGLSKYLEEVDTFIFDTVGETYYVINATTNTFQVSTTHGGSAVDITSAGIGTHDWYTDVNKIVIDHNNGYYSPWLFSYNGTASSGGTSYFMSDDFEQLNVRIYENKTEIYIRVGFNGLSASTTVYFTCYQCLDDFTTYTADIIDIASIEEQVSSDIGFKVSKDGFDVKICDAVDLVMSSAFFSNVIHMKGNSAGTSTTHNLGYIPLFLAYKRPHDKSFLKLAMDVISINDTSLGWLLYPDDQAYYVIMKNESI